MKSCTNSALNESPRPDTEVHLMICYHVSLENVQVSDVRFALAKDIKVEHYNSNLLCGSSHLKDTIDMSITILMSNMRIAICLGGAHVIVNRNSLGNNLFSPTGSITN